MSWWSDNVSSKVEDVTEAVSPDWANKFLSQTGQEAREHGREYERTFREGSAQLDRGLRNADWSDIRRGFGGVSAPTMQSWYDNNLSAEGKEKLNETAAIAAAIAATALTGGAAAGALGGGLLGGAVGGGLGGLVGLGTKSGLRDETVTSEQWRDAAAKGAVTGAVGSMASGIDSAAQSATSGATGSAAGDQFASNVLSGAGKSALGSAVTGGSREDILDAAGTGAVSGGMRSAGNYTQGATGTTYGDEALRGGINSAVAAAARGKDSEAIADAAQAAALQGATNQAGRELGQEFDLGGTSTGLLQSALGDVAGALASGRDVDLNWERLAQQGAAGYAREATQPSAAEMQYLKQFPPAQRAEELKKLRQRSAA